MRDEKSTSLQAQVIENLIQTQILDLFITNQEKAFIGNFVLFTITKKNHNFGQHLQIPTVVQ